MKLTVCDLKQRVAKTSARHGSTYPGYKSLKVVLGTYLHIFNEMKCAVFNMD